MATEIPDIFYTFGPQLTTFMCVGILLKYFRLKFLQFVLLQFMSVDAA